MSDLGPEGVAANPSAFIVGMVEEGRSATSALADFRAAGGAMGNETWYSLYGEIRATVGNRDRIQGLDYSAIPGPEHYTPWAAGAEGQYATFVQVNVKMPGNREPEQRFFTYVTSDPHAPQEAVDWAENEAALGAAEGGTFAGQQILGGVVTSMTRTIGRAA